MRDHRKLKAFQLADALVLLTYQKTANFPKSEQFGLTNQMRRASVSVASNIVEGSARFTEAEYIRFLDMAYGSVCELEYQISVAVRLSFIATDQTTGWESAAHETARTLNGLLRALRRSPEA
jgi:four helix bundle protein